jgi:hypothetical protein
MSDRVDYPGPYQRLGVLFESAFCESAAIISVMPADIGGNNLGQAWIFIRAIFSALGLPAIRSYTLERIFRPPRQARRNAVHSAPFLPPQIRSTPPFMPSVFVGRQFGMYSWSDTGIIRYSPRTGTDDEKNSCFVDPGIFGHRLRPACE